MREFARRYWAADYGPSLNFQYRENVGPLAQTYGWKIHEVKDKLAEIVVATYGTCSECLEPIIVRHRTDLYHKASAVVCQSCVDRTREARDREREEYYQRYPKPQAQRTAVPAAAISQYELRQMNLRAVLKAPAPLYLDKINLEDAVYLDAAFRASQSEYFLFICPLANTLRFGSQHPVTPGSLFTTDLIKHLRDRGIIGVAPESDHEAFDWNTNDAPVSYIFEKVIWQIAPVIGFDSSAIELLESTFRELGAESRIQILPLWRKIALHECLEFLKLQMSNHGLPFKPGPKTQMVIEDGLTTYSVSQLYNQIHRATKDAAAYYMEKSSTITVSQAANSVVGRIQNLIQYARVQKWDITPFRRNFNCPRSEISRVLFDAVLKIGDAGFDELPRELGPAIT
jgi:hypothetical protein